jgi:hypothetical protein
LCPFAAVCTIVEFQFPNDDEPARAFAGDITAEECAARFEVVIPTCTLPQALDEFDNP